MATAKETVVCISPLCGSASLFCPWMVSLKNPCYSHRSRVGFHYWPWEAVRGRSTSPSLPLRPQPGRRLHSRSVWRWHFWAPWRWGSRGAAPSASTVAVSALGCDACCVTSVHNLQSPHESDLGTSRVLLLLKRLHAQSGDCGCPSPVRGRGQKQLICSLTFLT